MTRLLIIFLFLAGFAAKANPLVKGEWTGYVIVGETKLKSTLYLSDDNDNGEITADIVMNYTYTDGKIYSCKAHCSGHIDYKKYDFTLVMEEFVYFDLLPEGMKWCLGTMSCSIRREMQMKQYILLGRMTNKCSPGESQLVMIKRQ
jgi:hypothetical protein